MLFAYYTPESPGLSQARPEPGQGPGPGPGPGFLWAQARLSQAQALAFGPSQALHITTVATSSSDLSDDATVVDYSVQVPSAREDDEPYGRMDSPSDADAPSTKSVGGPQTANGDGRTLAIILFPLATVTRFVRIPHKNHSVIQRLPPDHIRRRHKVARGRSGVHAKG